MKLTQEQIDALKALGLTEDEIKSLDATGLTFEEIKAVAEAAQKKAKEQADAAAKAKATEDVTKGIVDRVYKEHAASIEKAAEVRKAQAGLAIEIGHSIPETIKLAKAFGLETENAEFLRPRMNDGKSRNLSDTEKAGLFLTGAMLKAAAIGDRASVNKMNAEVEGMQKGLVTSSAHFGGFLVPVETLNLFVETRDATGPYRQLVTSIPVNSKSGNFAAESDQATWSRKTEAQAKGATRPRFNQLTYTVTEDTAVIVWSDLLAMTSYIDIASYVTRHLARTKAKREWAVFITGTGSSQPRGLANSTAGNTFASGGTITFEDYNGLYFALPIQYRDNGVFIFRDSNVETLHNLKGSTNDHPIYLPPGMAVASGTRGPAFGGILKGKNIYVNDNITQNTAAVPKNTVYFLDPSYYYHFDLQELRMDVSQEATITDESGSSVSLWQTNQFAIKAWNWDDAKLSLSDALATGTTWY